MSFVIIDLEFNNLVQITNYVKDYFKNNTPKSEECPNEIIQIGAIRYDKYLKPLDELKIYIKPCIYNMINPKITELTGITEDLLENGLDFKEALEQLQNFIEEGDVLCSWAKDDIVELIRNAHYHNITSFKTFRKYIDLQEYCTKIMGEKNPLGLKNALDKLRVRYNKNNLHDALYDCKCTAEVFKRVYNSRIISNYIVEDLLNMPCINISESEKSKVDESKLNCTCSKCGGEIEYELPIKFFNWRYVAYGYCRECKSKIAQETVIKKSMAGNLYYYNKNRIIDDNKYNQYIYKLKENWS